jgi:Uma2 family endonuclease
MSILEPVITGPSGRPFTRADLDAMPDDGHRYELIDGVLVVTPAPVWMHQRVHSKLFGSLLNACPPDLEVLSAPFDVALAEDTVMQPDLLVARRADYSVRGLEQKPPVLAVEVLSPSTRRIDLMLKWSRFEAAGCRSYWVIDPDDPSLVAWDLQDGRYVEVGKVSGDEEFRAELPFPVGVIPADLVR